jgi:hypothetical protein
MPPVPVCYAPILPERLNGVKRQIAVAAPLGYPSAP